jgi:hypothetical protein
MLTGALGPTRETLWFLMCPTCLASHPAHQRLEGIGIEDTIDRRDLDAAMYESGANLPGHVAGCGLCVDEALLRGTRSRGEIDPFVVYERTLWPIHRPQIEELREHMARAVSLERSSVAIRPSVDVFPGTLREPTSISVCGLLDSGAQSRVVDAARAFLVGREHDQARVVFLRIRDEVLRVERLP